MAATVVVPSAIVLKVLNTADNYDDWSVRVKTYLQAKGLWNVVESNTEPPSRVEAEYEGWSKKNAEALHAIYISCGEDTFSFIRDIDTAKAAWNTLEKKLKPAGLPTTTDEISEHQSPVDGGLQLKDLERRPVVNVEGDNSNSNAAADDDIYKSFFNLVKEDWKESSTSAALNFLKEHPETIRRRDPSSGLPALHFAIKEWNTVIAKELVRLMTEEDLEEILDPSGRTALFYAIDYLTPFCDMKELVECMVEKNKKLLSMVHPSHNMIPLVMGLMANRFDGFDWVWRKFCKATADYLYSSTPRDTLNAHQAAQIISQGFMNKIFDISWDLIQRYPSLAITKDLSGKYPLNTLAESMKHESLFLSQSRLNFWERWIYDRIVIPPTPTISDTSSITVHSPENDQCKERRLIDSVTSLFRGLFTRFPGFNRIHRMKMLHTRIDEFLSCMCQVIEDKEVTQMQDDNLLKSAIFRAVEQGKFEFIIHLCKANEEICQITNEQDMTVFQFAADCRREKIYRLAYVYGPWFVINRRDKFDNNMLHTVASFSSLAQTRMNHIRGAALQMQREQQWFKEVQYFTTPEGFEVINHTDQLPPHAVFTKYHKDLMKEGEKSMKETATSCTVVGALIVTMMFAAAFTVPGGNKDDTGAPIFLEAKAFIIFIISDAISLFSSTTSVVTFLGILTSRYKEDDFLKSLPTKMIVGLFTLFLSIATMMIAFSAALYIMLHGKSWIVIPIILLSGVPIASFVWMQFPFFVEIFISTYGADIFERKTYMDKP
ncbi:hypothetical protein M0R45_033081 [Rubus argutus]|uniref:PGG domain-containing protein n=1 Tax=Rubus argutus TaxID=59490 RepID=A0AAW1WJ47_RUBAR